MAIIVNNPDVEFVAQLLQIDPTALTDVLTQKLHVSFYAFIYKIDLKQLKFKFSLKSSSQYFSI